MEFCLEQTNIGSRKRKSSPQSGRMPASKKRVVADSVHGQIHLPDICWKIVDTPQFQRLKNIKQLGTCDFVFPCAGHDRKQHSIGVCHLAGVFLDKLIANHADDGNDLHVSKKERVMVQIAALCHDLGHGPFSHTFDGVFIPLVNPESTYQHEIASVQMFNRLLRENPLVKCELDRILAPVDPKDYIFIEECLSGIAQGKKDDPWPFIGCGPEKAFLYELISNKRCGVDVDRFDYIVRDCFYLNIKNAFDAGRVMENTRVLEIAYNGGVRNVLGFRDKITKDIQMLGHMRQSLHQQAYQHKANKAVELMYVDALRLCDQRLVFKCSKGNLLPLSQTINDMEAFERVDDSVIARIKWLDDETDPKVAEAVEILNRIDRRQLFFFVGQCMIEPNDKNQNEALLDSLKQSSLIVEQMCSLWPSTEHEPASSTNSNVTVERLKQTLIVSVADIHHGMKEKDPALQCVFFRKNERHTPLTYGGAMGLIEDPLSQPKSFRIHIVRVFSRVRDDEELLQAANEIFCKWCEKNGGKQTVGDSLEHFSSTPLKISVTHNLNTPPLSPIRR